VGNQSFFNWRHGEIKGPARVERATALGEEISMELLFWRYRWNDNDRLSKLYKLVALRRGNIKARCPSHTRKSYFACMHEIALFRRPLDETSIWLAHSLSVTQTFLQNPQQLDVQIAATSMSPSRLFYDAVLRADPFNKPTSMETPQSLQAICRHVAENLLVSSRSFLSKIIVGRCALCSRDSSLYRWSRGHSRIHIHNHHVSP